MKPERIVAPRLTGGGSFARMPLAVQWVANDLLVVDFNNGEVESIDLHGKPVAVLGAALFEVLRSKGEPSETVFAATNGLRTKFSRVNARTGAAREIEIALPGELASWVFDDNGALRAVTMADSAIFSDNTKLSHWYRVSEQAPWQLLETFAATDDFWLPLSVMPEPDTLMVQSRRGRDTWAIFAYDVSSRANTELLAGHALEDISGAANALQPGFEGVTTLGMKPMRHWFDARWAQLQGVVDEALPGRLNTLRGDPNGRVLIFSHADVDPGRWLVLDTVAKTLRLIAPVKPTIDPALMRPMQTMDYRARDGMTLHAYLTMPAVQGDTKPPLIVLIHGGPQVRDGWGWNEEVQILARNGYAVFQPQFRGSAGFGRQYEEAGYRQWGLAMQDDITDGVKTLTDSGSVDASKVCINGASYGGYAALWGLIKTPELYRCGVSVAGVSDLAALLADRFGTDSTAWVREVRRNHIGDIAMAPAQIDAVSPVKHLDRLRLPLLVAHGEQDSRVPHEQSKRLVRSLRDQGNTVEWLSFAREGHGLIRTESRLRYYEAMLAFLQRSMAATPAPPATEAKR